MWFIGSTLLGSGSINGFGVATYSTGYLSVGSHTIIAVYSGNTNFTNSTGTLSGGQTVKTPTITFLGSFPNPSEYGKSVQFIAVVLPRLSGNTPTVIFNNGVPEVNNPAANTLHIPTGTVIFMNGATQIGTATLGALGIATFNSSLLPASTNSITAEYLGDTNSGSSTSSPITQTVKYGTSTKVTSSSSTSTFGQSVTFTAAISSSGSNPTGTVTFTDGNSTIGNNVPLVGNVATLTLNSLSVGIHNIGATYSGDNSFDSSSGNLTQTVNKANSSTKVTSSPNPSNHGQPITFTATISAASPGTGTPTGTVTFKDGNTTLGTGKLNAVGVATYSTSSLSKGTRNITAVFAGDSNFNGSTSTAILQIVN